MNNNQSLEVLIGQRVTVAPEIRASEFGNGVVIRLLDDLTVEVLHDCEAIPFAAIYASNMVKAAQ
jgi:hypothetical protein